MPESAAPLAALVVGASAGAIEALLSLLPALPADTTACVLVVVHLPPGRDSLLTRIFQPHCVLPLREARDGDPASAGTVYFAPPDYHLLVDAGPRLALSIDPSVSYSRPSIDVLFESAADLYGDRLMATLLTGANHDGAAGLQTVRRRGGRTVVQDPATAQVAAMPQAALRAGPIDHVLPLPEIARLWRRVVTLSPPDRSGDPS